MSYENLIKKQRRAFYGAQDLLIEVVAYFKWCDENPLQEEKIFQFKGSVIRAETDKVRPYTKKGLCTFLGIPESRLASYKLQSEYADAMEMIEQVIFTQKFENAAAGLMNATIISRDLGLADRQEHTGANGGPIETKELSPRERISSKLASLAARSAESADTSGDDG